MRKGSILVLVLIVLSSLMVLAVGFTYRTRLQIKLAGAYARQTQAYYLALGGIERMKALITRQELSPQVISEICSFTSSAQLEGLLEPLNRYGIMENTSLIYSLRDEQALLNINVSDPASWQNVPFLPAGFSAEILDWIDTDNDTSPEGAETDYYSRLNPPYLAKNNKCVLLKEILWLKSAAPALYTGEDLNRNGLLDENERDGPAHPPSDNQDNILDLGFTDVFTVYGTGKININTAPPIVLAAVPGLDEGAAELIIAHRLGPDGIPGTDDDIPIANTDDIKKIQGLTDLQIELLQQYCCFDSQYFRAYSHAELADNFHCSLMATIQYTDNQPNVICLDILP